MTACYAVTPRIRRLYGQAGLTSRRSLLLVLTTLAMFYGFCMGWFAVLRDEPQYAQVLASMLKVPLLFLLTLLVTFPSLYVFNALIGSRLSFLMTLRLMVAFLAVLVAVTAAFGPIVAFFSATSTSYPFILILNVAVFALAGILGTNFLLQTLHRLTDALYTQPAATDAPAEEAGPLDRLETEATRNKVRVVFYVWVGTFALVGGQMAWVLRPFIGYPGTPFTWLRERQSNFIEAVIHNLGRLFQP